MTELSKLRSKYRIMQCVTPTNHQTILHMIIFKTADIEWYIEQYMLP